MGSHTDRHTHTNMHKHEKYKFRELAIVQQLREHLPLLKGTGVQFSVPTWLLTAVCNFSSRKSFWSLRALHEVIHSQTLIHMN